MEQLSKKLRDEERGRRKGACDSWRGRDRSRKERKQYVLVVGRDSDTERKAWGLMVHMGSRGRVEGLT